MPNGFTIEQYDWLERKGVADACNYNLIRQTSTQVVLRHKTLGLIISRKKDMVGQRF